MFGFIGFCSLFPVPDFCKKSIDKIQQMWTSLTDALFIPHTEDEYNQLARFLDTVIDEVGEDENHPLASLIEIIGVLIERYETEEV